MRKYLLAIALALMPLTALAQGAGVSLVTTPPDGSVVPLLSTSPLNIGITADNFASWAGLTSSPGDTNIGTGVNKVSINGAATTVAPLVTVGGASSDTNVGINLAGKGTGIATLGGEIATCSGTTTATCSGQRFVVSITGLTTAAGGTSSAAMVVTNTSIASSSNLVWCAVNGYAGGGTPIATTIIPDTSQVSLKITNVAGSGALDATVPVACIVQ